MEGRLFSKFATQKKLRDALRVVVVATEAILREERVDHRVPLCRRAVRDLIVDWEAIHKEVGGAGRVAARRVLPVNARELVELWRGGTRCPRPRGDANG